MERKKKLLLDTVCYVFDMFTQLESGAKYNEFRTKQIIKKILKEDEKKIKKTFILPSENELLDSVYSFLYKEIYIKPEYFETSILTEEQQNEVWNAFKRSINDVVGIESKKHLIDCINYHNNQICSKLLDSSFLFSIKVQEVNNRKWNNKFNEIIDILKSDAAIQNDDYDLNYLSIQLNSILCAFRTNMSEMRKMQIRYLIGIVSVFICIACVPIFGKYYDWVVAYSKAIFIAAFLIIGLLSLILIMSVIKIYIQEKKFDRLLRELYQLHFKLYAMYIGSNINGKCVGIRFEKDTMIIG